MTSSATADFDPTVPRRIRVANRSGTIRYAGAVTGTSGLWYGVEWDDAVGKHNGTHNGTTYFTTRKPAAGSFIRPVAAKIDEALPLIDVLHERYPATTASTGSGAAPALTTTNDASLAATPGDLEKPDVVVTKWAKTSIDVEMVGFNKVAKKQRLEQLHEANLVDSRAGVLPSPVSILGTTLPLVQTLDLSGCMLGSWADVAQLCRCLPNLHSIHLNRLRLDLPAHEQNDEPNFKGAFDRIRIMSLNLTFHQPHEITRLSRFWTALEELHLGFNELHAVPVLHAPTLRHLNLQNNAIDLTTLSVLEPLANLRHLNLQWNNIQHIREDVDPCLTQVEELWLTDNAIADWQSVDALAAWTGLRELRITRNPVYSNATDMDQARIQVIARLPQINMLNRSEVSEKSRLGAELYFLKLAAEAILATTGVAIPPDVPAAELRKRVPADIIAAFPTLIPLAAKHGLPWVTPPETEKIAVQSVTVKRNADERSFKIPVSSTLVRAFKSMVARSFKIPPRKLVLEVTDSVTGRVERLEDDGRHLSFYNIEDGTVVQVVS
ncbi:hypothetical protein BCR44DRAFT_49628 [Catenaria anguillulae PL171]|uniref:CAP-Gly domain-containing protein n=1 Tax=Catenaria anguillulae PL171 TaxID=765915 RepID=A0A1Y2HT23_9FUNG|nr:hypothetical protein BCR44DRAFT_49628 [Catenaria anguillulae PL171]